MLWEWTDDPGMKDTLSFLIARDTMHQNQWLAVIEELQQPLPVPSDFSHEHHQFSYQYFVQSTAPIPENARFAQGRSIDGKGEFSMVAAKPLGPIPTLAPAPAENHSLVLPKNGSSSPDVISKTKEAVEQTISHITGNE
jgi:Mn-containing catalase